jgi:putative membrane protein (TIGR04086 family)
VLLGLGARSVFAPIPGLVATVIGIAVGGFVAGKWAKQSGFYHGAVVAVGWIALEALGAVPTASYASDALVDTVLVIALDVVMLFAGSIGGYLARPGPLSSSDTGRGR